MLALAQLLLFFFQLPSNTVVPSGSTGTAPTCYALLCGSSISPPSDASFSWVNQGVATKTATTDYVTLQDVDAGGDQIRLRVVSTPATPFTLTAGFIVSNAGGGTWGVSAGIAARQSSDGKLIIAGRAHVTASTYFLIQSFTNETTFSANQVFINGTNNHMGPITWVRYTDNGTNRFWYVSTDGITFNEVKNEARTTFLTADQIGFYLDTFDGNRSITLVHWKFT